MSQLHDQVRRRQRRAAALRPFDQQQRGRIGQIGQTEPLQLARIGDPVQVQMMQRALVNRFAP